MRAVLVGAGGMGQAWARNLRDSGRVQVSGWVDVRPGAASEAAVANEIHPEWTGTDLAQAIRDLQPDFVVDVTSPNAHYDVTLTALRSGIPVLGEKPMAESMAQARAMVKAADEAGKLYMVSQSRRYNALLRSFRDLIREQLGGVGALWADFAIGAHFGGFRDEMDHVLLLDMAIHTFDEARYLSGADPVSVYAEEYSPAWSWYRGAAAANCLFEMSDGLRFTYRGSWCFDGLPTSWNGDWRAAGPNGSAVWVQDTLPRAEHVVGQDGFMRPVEAVEGGLPDQLGGIGGSLAQFLDALEHGSTPEGECHDNIQSLAMVFAAIESSKRGERVWIAELLEG